MKSLLLTLAISLGAQTASAAYCIKPEAQYAGVVTQVQSYDYYQFITECFYKIKFTEFTPSNVCPLDEKVASETTYYDPTCGLKVGSQVSGYLTVRNGIVVID